MEYANAAGESDWVAEANPIKQGLKLYSLLSKRVPSRVAEANPIKQGLKLSVQTGNWDDGASRRG